MFVSQSMTQEVVTIDKDADIYDAHRLMGEHRIRHLPVIDSRNLLIGIVTDRDLRSALPQGIYKKGGGKSESEKKVDLKAKDIMSIDPVTISPQLTIQDALLLAQKTRVGALPVVDEANRLTGILSVRDLLRAFINVLGIGEPGTLICIVVEEKIGQMKKIVDAITEENVSMGSILVARYWEEGKRVVFAYLLTLNVTGVKKRLEDVGFELLDPMRWYMDQLPKARA
ncbi:conserved hypothetical protein [Candidatus Desulfarcum epimagneticum]|uniref:CBS domain-containing protein n=1 Tax=uncultured Desulfobacteraceae bacterium TaxID=218296 RepID=A0A484HDL0_9BACT|nr:conserved hypothetical protein [uncultured Desulfobacteraceae bacterium]